MKIIEVESCAKCPQRRYIKSMRFKEHGYTGCSKLPNVPVIPTKYESDFPEMCPLKNKEETNE